MGSWAEKKHPYIGFVIFMFKAPIGRIYYKPIFGHLRLLALTHADPCVTKGHEEEATV